MIENTEFFDSVLGTKKHRILNSAKQDTNKITMSNKVEHNQVVTSDEKDDIIAEAVNKYIDKYGSSIEIYADYRDEMSDDDITKVLEAEDPKETFYEIIDSYYEDYAWEYGNTDLEYIIDNYLDLDREFIDENYDNIMEHLQEALYFEPDYNHFLKNVYVDALITEFDGTSEELYVYDEDTNDLIGVGRPVQWLLEKQGYTVDEFLKYYNELPNFENGWGKTDYNANTFLGSMAQEIDNAGRMSYTDLVFLGTIDLGTFIEGFNSVTFPKSCDCGYVDLYNGAGSLIEIVLEKDINVSAKDVKFSYYHKKRDGWTYSVDDIYGLSSSAWKTDIELNS